MLLVYIFVLVAMASATRNEEGPRTYCGRILANAQSLYCGDADSPNDKKSIDPPLEIKTLTDNDFIPWLARRYIYAVNVARRNKRFAGLVDECCLKPCQINELLSYC